MADNFFVNSLGIKFVPLVGTKVLFGAWNVRVKDYWAYAQVNNGVDRSWEQPGFSQGDDHPVVSVSWNDAQTFCAWLTKKEQAEGKISEDQGYRLPREVEWNQAVGNTKYPWGDQWPPPNGAGNYDLSLNVDNYEFTSPVRSFAANRHGFYDMGGNVWQWCEDWFDSEKKYRTLRGASWCDSSHVNLLSTRRDRNLSDNRDYNVGFRCVLASESSR